MTLRNLKVTGISTFQGNINQTGGVFTALDARIGSVSIASNVISSRSGSGSQLYIDPYPDGLSNEGDVIIKGNLQVDGTTTTVNSTQTTVNDPIMMVGDTTSTRTVMTAMANGASACLLYTSPSPRDRTRSRMPSSA